MRQFVLGLLASLLLPIAAQAVDKPADQAADPDWWWVVGAGKAPDQMEIYVDRNSIERLGDRYVKAWIFTLVEKPFPNGEVMSLSYEIMDCDKRTYTYTARTSWDEHKKQIASGRFEGLPPVSVTPNSAADGLRRYMCRDHPLPSIAVSSPLQHAMKMWGRVPMDAPAPAEKSDKEESKAGYGTGFFVDANGDIVTSYHVIDGATTILVYTGDRAEHPASIVRASPATDLVVLHIDYRPAHHLTLAPPNSTKPGDHVFTFGFPVMEVLGAEPKYTDGAISSLSGIGGEAAFAQISVPVQPGNSGGPVVNEQGAVVGVVAAQAAVKEFVENTGSIPQNVNWAVRSEYIAPLVGSQPPSRALSRDDAVALARQSVVIVYAESEEEK